MLVAFATAENSASQGGSSQRLYAHTLLLGNEGAAKTLAITTFLAAAKGPFSASPLFRALPPAQPMRLQLSATAFFVAVLRSLVPVVVAMDLAYVLGARHLAADTWAGFVLKATAVGLPGLVIGFLVGLPPSMREQLREKFGFRRPRPLPDSNDPASAGAPRDP